MTLSERIRNGPPPTSPMTWPDRFPFDVLDPDPSHCGNCSCALADGEVLPDCRAVSCECHTEWLAQTPENELRALWGDK